MKVAFFDTKPYDVPGFDHYAAAAGLEIKYFETRLNADTVSLASGFDAVCVFVNDTVDSAVVEKLYEMGVKVIALRCAGFNNGYPGSERQASRLPGACLLPLCRGRARHGPAADHQPPHPQGLYPHPGLQFQSPGSGGL